MTAYNTITEMIESVMTCPICNEHEPDGLEACSKCYNSQIHHIAKLENKLDLYRKDYEDAAGECLVDIPEPGTDMARLLAANCSMRTKIQKLEKQLRDTEEDIMEHRERNES
jgi:hypothetical protein